MIGYIKGRVMLITAEYAIIETGGIGYRVFMAGSALARMEKDTEVRLYIYTNVREDAIQLYGFFDYEEYDIFLKLISVSGIGPKVGVGILSAITPDSFRLAVLNQDVKEMTRLPGVGKKTAERMLLELRDKLGFSKEERSFSAEVFAGGSIATSVKDEVMQALLALGYDKNEILPQLKKVSDDITVEEMIKSVLKGLAGR